MKEWLEQTVKSLVDTPEEVKVSVTEGSTMIAFVVKVLKKENGQLIGRGGQNIKSIQTLLSAMATKEKKRVNIAIEE